MIIVSSWTWFTKWREKAYDKQVIVNLITKILEIPQPILTTKTVKVQMMLQVYFEINVYQKHQLVINPRLCLKPTETHQQNLHFLALLLPTQYLMEYRTNIVSMLMYYVIPRECNKVL